MKRCPQCSTVYTDDTLNFCLDDGSTLVETIAEAKTAILPGYIQDESHGGSQSIAADRTSRHTSAAAELLPNSGDETRILPGLAGQNIAVHPHRSRWPVWIIAAAALVLVALGSAWFYRSRVPQSENKGAAFQSSKITRLTSTGLASDAGISPDGKYVAHVKLDGGRRSLWLRHVETTSDTQIVPPTDETIASVSFSNDGNYVYFRQGWSNSLAYSLYQVPVLGGQPRKILSDTVTGASFSADGKRMAFGRPGAPSSSIILVADADGSNERVIATRSLPGGFAGTPALAPDGRSVAVGVSRTDETGSYASLIELGVDDGAEKSITAERWTSLGSFAWLPDKSGIVFTASAEGESESQIWFASYPSGAVQKITNDLNDYSGIGLTADGKTLVTVKREGEANIWMVSLASKTDARQITTGKAWTGTSGISWTPDGRIVYGAEISGSDDLWIAASDGSAPRQLTSNARRNTQPAASPDGRFVVFRSNRTGIWNIWRIDIDGGNPKQLTQGVNDSRPDVSPDGKWVTFTSTHSGGQNLWKVSIDGGEAVAVTNKYAINGSISPDGSAIACQIRESRNEPRKIGLIPFAGGDPIKLLDISPTFTGRVRWHPDGRSILYTGRQPNLANIWSLPLVGSKAKQITDFKSEDIFAFDISRDGNSLAVSRGTVTSDVVLIKGMR